MHLGFSHHFDVCQLFAEYEFLRIFDEQWLTSPSAGLVGKYAKRNMQCLVFGFAELPIGLDIESLNGDYLSAKTL